MKTLFLTGSALMSLLTGFSASAVDVSIGGEIEAAAINAKEINPGELSGSYNDGYNDDELVEKDVFGRVKGELTITSQMLTRFVDYGAHVSLDFEHETGSSVDQKLELKEIDAHIRVRFSHGTLRFGTDIDGLQDVEDLDWVVSDFFELDKSISVPISSHDFTYGIQKALKDKTESLIKPVSNTSVTFTTNNVGGLSLAGELSPGDENKIDWSASIKYEGSLSYGTSIKAVIGTDSSKAIMANAQANIGDFSANAFYGKDDDEDKYMGFALAYDLGALYVSGGYVRNDAGMADNKKQVTERQYVLGIDYEISPGLTLGASYFDRRREVGKDLLGDEATADQSLSSRVYAGRIKLKF